MKRGFTLIEMILVIAIVAVISVVALANLTGTRGKNELESAVKEIAATLREAGSNAAAGKQGVPWGVHFENATATAPFFAIFASSTYAASAVSGYYRLPPKVAYATSSVALGASLDVVFSQVTGAPSSSTSVTLYVPAQASLSSTILISPSGAVSY